MTTTTITNWRDLPQAELLSPRQRDYLTMREQGATPSEIAALKGTGFAAVGASLSIAAQTLGFTGLKEMGAALQWRPLGERQPRRGYVGPMPRPRCRVGDVVRGTVADMLVTGRVVACSNDMLLVDAGHGRYEVRRERAELVEARAEEVEA